MTTQRRERRRRRQIRWQDEEEEYEAVRSKRSWLNAHALLYVIDMHNRSLLLLSTGLLCSYL